MQFEEVAALPRDTLERIFSSGGSNEIAHALVSAAFHEADWRWVQGWCLKLASHSDVNVRRLSVVALGHLARIHRVLDLESVLPVLASKAEESELAGTIEDTIDDIRQFITAH